MRKPRQRSNRFAAFLDRRLAWLDDGCIATGLLFGALPIGCVAILEWLR